MVATVTLKLLARWAAICVGVLPALALAQAGASSITKIDPAIAGCQGADGVTTGTSTSLFSIAGLADSSGGCTARASAYAYAGVVGATVKPSFSGPIASPGAVIGEASASWKDGLTAVWSERFSLTNLGTLRLNYNIGAHGGVSVTGRGQADIGHSISINGVVVGAGTNTFPSGERGNWGTIAGSIDVTPTGGSGNDYQFASFGLGLSGYANARAIPVNDSQNPIQNVSASADFGNTLIWLGIVSAQAFDTSGVEMVLPDGFVVGLIGAQTGMDYLDAAVRQPVPEPGIWVLMLAGLGLLGARLRRRE